MDCVDISLKNISLELGGKNILRNVNLELKAGNIHVIYGKSGSGKTSLLNIMNGLYVPTQGSYYFKGKKVAFDDERSLAEMRKSIGYFHQELALVEDITLEDNLKLFSHIKGYEIDSVCVKKQLENMGISHLYRENVSFFSGGERQRAAFLKLLLFECPVLLIDEPTNNLDNENMEYIVKALEELGKSGKNVVVVSHSEKIKEIADNIHHMEEINGAR